MITGVVSGALTIVERNASVKIGKFPDPPHRDAIQVVL